MDASQAELSNARLEPTKVEKKELSGPDFRAHVRRRDDPMPNMTLYAKNASVYLIKSRGLEGPYTVSRVNADGTYQLSSESGKVWKDGVKERDLQPL